MLTRNLQTGLTFVELLVALIIAAILAVIAMPTFGSSAPNCDDPNARQGPLMRAKIGQVTGDIGKIHMALSAHIATRLAALTDRLVNVHHAVQGESEEG